MMGGFGRGLGLMPWVRVPNTPPWTPEELFANGERGGWYDPSDLSTLWQDAAGTTAVTADGDPVGRMDDKSGNGLHVTAASSSRRPTYKTDGTFHWLDFDGTDDRLDSNDVSPLVSSANGFMLIIGQDADDSACVNQYKWDTDQRVFRIDEGAPVGPHFAVYPNDSGHEDYQARLVGDLDVGPSVISGWWPGDGNVSSIQLLGEAAVSGSRATTLNATGFTRRLEVGGRSGGSYTEGKIFGVILVDKYSAGALASAQSWMSSKVAS